jgi:polyadenylation factor subunit 2
MRDKYNLNTLPASLAGLEEYEMDDHIVIPGMGIEEQNDFNEPQMPMMDETSQISSSVDGNQDSIENGAIPGLDMDLEAPSRENKKTPYNKPIPKNFQDQWNVESKGSDGRTMAHDPTKMLEFLRNVVMRVMERLPGIVQWDETRPEKIQIYGKNIDIKRES